jgi:AraC-like DNA-binding protein
LSAVTRLGAAAPNGSYLACNLKSRPAVWVESCARRFPISAPQLALLGGAPTIPARDRSLPNARIDLERASEFVFVDAARRYLDSLPPGSADWLGALRDRHVGPTIALMHERPAQDCSVEELGRQVGLSRSSLHERFVELTGQAPMQYLAHWRMQIGAGLLRHGRAKVADVAQEVGYESEAAFARAFKRLMGQPPAAWRRSQAG